MTDVAFSAVGTATSFGQTIAIAHSVTHHLFRYRQLRPWSCEAGGQLFGLLNGSSLQVRAASGPYLLDKRSRFSYRSNPESAQRAINRHASIGLFYLGEWHTHPEAVPTPSAEDVETIQKVVRRSELRSSSLLLLIQGTNSGLDGLSAYSTDGSGMVRWALRDVS
jgi:integrative and conjugative element protein (TIGR02256 family)